MKSISFEGSIHYFPDDFTDEDISAALSGADTAPSAPAQPPVNTLSDVGIGAARGLVNGTAGMLGIPADAGNAAVAGLNYLKPGAGDIAKQAFQYTPLGLATRGMIGSNEAKRDIESITGPIPEPTGSWGKMAKSVAEFAPGVAVPGGTLPMRAASAVLGGVGSELAGRVSGDDPYAKLAGGIVGALTPNAAARAITPIATSPERLRNVATLADEGVTSLTAGQRTGNKALQYAESILGDALGSGQGASRIQQEGQRQFTTAAARRAGAGPDVSQEVLAQNQARLGQIYDDLSARNTLVFDQAGVDAIRDTVRNYKRVPNSQQDAIIQGYLDDIVKHRIRGYMPGAEYQAMRSMMSNQSQAIKNTDPFLSNALKGLRDALDDNMGRSISPSDRAAWKLNNEQYRAQKVLENSAASGGVAAADGQLTPAGLKTAAAAGNRGAYARGQAPFSELASAGQGVMTPLPNSGTAQRVAISSILGGGAGLTGGLTAGLGALAAPAVAGRALMSRPIQSYLGNSLLNLESLSPSRRALLRALMGQERPAIESRY